MSALRKHLVELPAYELQNVWLNRFNEAGVVARQFSVSVAEVRKLSRQIETADNAAGYAVLKAWHEELLTRPDLSASEKVAAIRVWTFVNSRHRYAWPSQDRLAKELGYSRGPNFGKVLRRSFEIGAYTPVRVKNLPPEVKVMAVKDSHRSLRGVAYRLNPVEKWDEEAAVFQGAENGHMFHGGTFECSITHHLNKEGNQERAAPDSISDLGDYPETLRPAATSQNMVEGGKRCA